MEPINICYLINSKFLQLTLDSINYIRKFFRSKDGKLKFYIIGMDDFAVPDDIIYVPSSFRYLPMDWQRAYIPQILNLKRVIYLDSDTVTSTCISKLWFENLHDNIIGAVQHSLGPTIGHMANNFGLDGKSFNIYKDKPFFNSGVMLIDCTKWLDNDITSKCLDILEEYKQTRWSRRNEPAFSVALVDRWKQLDERWNYLPRGSYKKAFITHYYGQYFGQKPMHNMF